MDDVAEIGYSSRLLFSMPLFRVLAQAVAESDGAESRLTLTTRSGASVLVAKTGRGDALTLAVDPNASVGPGDLLNEGVLLHGFTRSPTGIYELKVRFDEDEAFDDVARLIIGTFHHAWGADLREHVRVELSLSLPPSTGAPD